MKQRYAENNHEAKLDIRCGTDAESAGEKAGDDSCDDAANPQGAAGKERGAHRSVRSQPAVFVKFDVEDHGAGKEHDAGNGTQKSGRHEIGDIRADESADDPAEADHCAGPDDHFFLTEMADGAGQHGKDHGGQCYGKRCMDGDAKADREQCDRNAGAAGAHKADQRTEQKHGKKQHEQHSLSDRNR